MKQALLSVTDKSGLEKLAKAFVKAGVKIVATGGTGSELARLGIAYTPIEEVSRVPEAFQGRMKTLSFHIFSAILFRRSDPKDLKQAESLGIEPIDYVVVNFYDFVGRREIEAIDIGGPSLVRAAAKNFTDVSVLTSPDQYENFLKQFSDSGETTLDFRRELASQAWDRIAEYDKAISAALGQGRDVIQLRYGENPHQKAELSLKGDPENRPLGWDENLTPHELSYNNILDVSRGYSVACDLKSEDSTSVVVIKHVCPCGAATVKGTGPEAQSLALELAWAGDPVSAFGSTVVFTSEFSEEAGKWLSSRFVETVVAPGLRQNSPGLLRMLEKRKNLKAVGIRKWESIKNRLSVSVPGGTLIQDPDQGASENFKSVTKLPFSPQYVALAKFGISIVKSLQSNAVILVHSPREGVFQTIGTGQGQPNRVEALRDLALARAGRFQRENAGKELDWSKVLLVSDAFFPFRDCVDIAARAGIRMIVQPGGSIRDQESIDAANEAGIAMVMTNVRHFRH